MSRKKTSAGMDVNTRDLGIESLMTSCLYYHTVWLISVSMPELSLRVQSGNLLVQYKYVFVQLEPP